MDWKIASDSRNPSGNTSPFSRRDGVLPASGKANFSAQRGRSDATLGYHFPSLGYHMGDGTFLFSLFKS